jgi:phage virion morphogenesis protein
MAEIRVTIDNTAALAALRRTREGLLNLRPAMKNVGEYLLLETDDRFRSQTAPDGAQWKPISRSWRQYKVKHGHITKILQMRGRLRKSIVYKASADQVSVGTNVVYANIHQFGGDITHYARSQTANFRIDKKTGQSRFAKKKKANFSQNVTIGAHTTSITARPFLGVNDENERAIGRIVADYINDQYQGS